MKFGDLPGFPGIWTDFLQSKLPALPAPGGVPDLAERARIFRDRALAHRDLIRVLASRQAEFPQFSENIQRLNQPDSVVVSTKVYAGLFGGPAGQILKCLTAVKVCEELTRNSINAVPIAWISPDPHPEFSCQSINLLNDDEEIHSFGVSRGETVPDGVQELLSRVADFGRGAWDSEVFDVLKTSFRPGIPYSTATALLFSHLLRPWGMLVIDPDSLGFGPVATKPAAWDGLRALPVLACVVDPFEVHSLVQALPDLDGAGLVRPIAWPQASATIGNARARRTLDRYRLQLGQLYSGEDAMLQVIRDELPRAGLTKVDSMMPEVETRIAELKTLAPAGDEFLKAVDSCAEKILFQLRKLRDHFETSLNAKEQTARRRIHKACNLLAPNGRLQERELAAVQFPLRHSHAGLRLLHDQLDVLRFEHQLLWMD